jgi:hypothetical protein
VTTTSSNCGRQGQADSSCRLPDATAPEGSSPCPRSTPWSSPPRHPEPPQRATIAALWAQIGPARRPARPARHRLARPARRRRRLHQHRHHALLLLSAAPLPLHGWPLCAAAPHWTEMKSLPLAEAPPRCGLTAPGFDGQDAATAAGRAGAAWEECFFGTETLGRKGGERENEVGLRLRGRVWGCNRRSESGDNLFLFTL